MMKISIMFVFCEDNLSFQHYFLLTVLRHAAPDLEMSSKCLKVHIQAEHISDSDQFPPPPIFRKTETYELLKENQLCSTSVS